MSVGLVRRAQRLSSSNTEEVLTLCRAFNSTHMRAGVLEQACARPGVAASREQGVLEAPCDALFEHFSRAELEELDCEGRVVMTDHGVGAPSAPHSPGTFQ